MALYLVIKPNSRYANLLACFCTGTLLAWAPTLSRHAMESRNHRRWTTSSAQIHDYIVTFTYQDVPGKMIMMWAIACNQGTTTRS